MDTAIDNGGTKITNVSATDRVRVCDENGTQMWISKSDLAEVIRSEMNLSTPTSKGLQLSSPLIIITPAIASLGYIDLKTDISNNNSNTGIVLDLKGVYGHNGGCIQNIKILFLLVSGKFSIPNYINQLPSNVTTKRFISIIAYKGSDGYIHIVINTTTSLNISGSIITAEIISNAYPSSIRNRIVSYTYQASTNYVDGTNLEESKVTI